MEILNSTKIFKQTTIKIFCKTNQIRQQNDLIQPTKIFPMSRSLRDLLVKNVWLIRPNIFSILPNMCFMLSNNFFDPTQPISLVNSTNTLCNMKLLNSTENLKQKTIKIFRKTNQMQQQNDLVQPIKIFPMLRILRDLLMKNVQVRMKVFPLIEKIIKMKKEEKKSNKL